MHLFIAGGCQDQLPNDWRDFCPEISDPCSVLATNNHCDSPIWHFKDCTDTTFGNVKDYCRAACDNCNG